MFSKVTIKLPANASMLAVKKTEANPYDFLPLDAMFHLVLCHSDP